MNISESISRIHDEISRACDRAGRSPREVRLMAVSKFHGSGEVLEAINAGLDLFGENRVQEAVSKFSDPILADKDFELHLIGSLQRNKVRQILPVVKCIQSVDRPQLLQELLAVCEKTKTNIDILFEYHTGEESKAGFQNTDDLFRAIDLLDESTCVRCAGLMTMAPFVEDRSVVRTAFRTLYNTRELCARKYPNLDFSCLSMGMSGDFSIAIEEGSTLVRIGTAIFGSRT